MSTDAENQPTVTGIAAVTAYLDAHLIAHEVVEHEPTMSAAAEADAAHRPKSQVAKTVILGDSGGYTLAIVPASSRLDLHKLRHVLGASKTLQLAGEDAIARDFPAFEVGAAPPFGSMPAKTEVIDSALLDADRILCAGGDHRHSVLLDPHDVVRLTDARVADVCEG